MSIITDISEALLEPFAEQEITIIVSGLSWGSYRDQLIIDIDEMDSISIHVEIDSSVAPLTTPTQFVRLGSVGAEHQVVKKVPISNLAPHPLQINLYLLDAFEKELLAEYGELPLPLDDELEPTENSPFNCGEFVQAIAFNNRKMPFKEGFSDDPYKSCTVSLTTKINRLLNSGIRHFEKLKLVPDPRSILK